MTDLSTYYSMEQVPTSVWRENIHYVSERLIQAIWHHLFLRVDALSTTDGRPVKILDRGQWNHDAGPDFRQAKIRIGDNVLHGDVEIHWRTSDWHAHGHDHDPKYDHVILHAVYEHNASLSGAALPVLEMRCHLTDGFNHLAEKLQYMGVNDETLFCAESIPRMDPSFVLREILKQGAERLGYKVQRFAELKASHHLTWNELFYYGIMDALGFSKNREPFRKLSQIVDYRELVAAVRCDNPTTALMRLQAILLGAGGLLTIDQRRVRGDLGIIPYLQRLETLWEEFRVSRPGLRPMAMSEWKLFRLRPSNFPTLRIAGWCRFVQLHAGTSLPDLFAKAAGGPDTTVAAWLSLLRMPAYGYWSDHYWWGDEGKHHLDDLIGAQRAFEIMVNVVMPVLKLWSIQKGRSQTGRLVDTVYQSARSHEKNSVLRFMQSQLLPESPPDTSVQFHQGLIQKHRQCRSYGCATCAIFGQLMETMDQDG